MIVLCGGRWQWQRHDYISRGSHNWEFSSREMRFPGCLPGRPMAGPAQASETEKHSYNLKTVFFSKARILRGYMQVWIQKNQLFFSLFLRSSDIRSEGSIIIIISISISIYIYLLSNLVELRPCGLLFHSTRL